MAERDEEQRRRRPPERTVVAPIRRVERPRSADETEAAPIRGGGTPGPGAGDGTLVAGDRTIVAPLAGGGAEPTEDAPLRADRPFDTARSRREMPDGTEDTTIRAPLISTHRPSARQPAELAKPWRLRSLRAAGDAAEIILSGRGAVIGRSHDCEVRLDSPSVSRQHARLRRRGDAWYLIPLEGKVVLANGAIVKDEVRLEPGMRLRIGGDELLAVEPGAPADDAPGASVDEDTIVSRPQRPRPAPGYALAARGPDTPVTEPPHRPRIQWWIVCLGGGVAMLLLAMWWLVVLP